MLSEYIKKFNVSAIKQYDCTCEDGSKLCVIFDSAQEMLHVVKYGDSLVAVVKGYSAISACIVHSEGETLASTTSSNGEIVIGNLNGLTSVTMSFIFGSPPFERFDVELESYALQDFVTNVITTIRSAMMYGGKSKNTDCNLLQSAEYKMLTPVPMYFVDDECVLESSDGSHESVVAIMKDCQTKRAKYKAILMASFIAVYVLPAILDMIIENHGPFDFSFWWIAAYIIGGFITVFLYQWYSAKIDYKIDQEKKRLLGKDKKG